MDCCQYCLITGCQIWPNLARRDNFVNFGCMVFEIHEWTDRHAHCSTSGEVTKYQRKLWNVKWKDFTGDWKDIGKHGEVRMI